MIWLMVILLSWAISSSRRNIPRMPHYRSSPYLRKAESGIQAGGIVVNNIKHSCDIVLSQELQNDQNLIQTFSNSISLCEDRGRLYAESNEEYLVNANKLAYRIMSAPSTKVPLSMKLRLLLQLGLSGNQTTYALREKTLLAVRHHLLSHNNNFPETVKLLRTLSKLDFTWKSLDSDTKIVLQNCILQSDIKKLHMVKLLLKSLSQLKFRLNVLDRDFSVPLLKNLEILFSGFITRGNVEDIIRAISLLHDIGCNIHEMGKNWEKIFMELFAKSRERFDLQLKAYNMLTTFNFTSKSLPYSYYDSRFVSKLLTYEHFNAILNSTALFHMAHNTLSCSDLVETSTLGQLSLANRIDQLLSDIIRDRLDERRLRRLIILLQQIHIPWRMINIEARLQLLMRIEGFLESYQILGEVDNHDRLFILCLPTINKLLQVGCVRSSLIIESIKSFVSRIKGNISYPMFRELIMIVENGAENADSQICCLALIISKADLVHSKAHVVINTLGNLLEARYDANRHLQLQKLRSKLRKKQAKYLRSYSKRMQKSFFSVAQRDYQDGTAQNDWYIASELDEYIYSCGSQDEFLRSLQPSDSRMHEIYALYDSYINLHNTINILIDASMNSYPYLERDSGFNVYLTIIQHLASFGSCEFFDQYSFRTMIHSLLSSAHHNNFRGRYKGKLISACAKLKSNNLHLQLKLHEFHDLINFLDISVLEISVDEAVRLWYFMSFLGYSFEQLSMSFRVKYLELFRHYHERFGKTQWGLLLWALIKLKAPINDLDDKLKGVLMSRFAS